MTMSIRRAVLTAGALVLLGFAAIGLVQAASSAGGAPATTLAAAPVAPATTTATSPDALETALAGQLDAILAADQTTASQPTAVDNAAGPGLRRLRLGRHLVHATVVLDLPEKGLTTIQVDHGTISKIGATSLSIAEAGGTAATVTLSDETRVRRNGEKAAIGDFKTGDEVFVMSKVESGGTNAYLVVVPKR